MIRRPPRSTRVRSSAASDVYKRQDLILRALEAATPGVEPDAAAAKLTSEVRLLSEPDINEVATFVWSGGRMYELDAIPDKDLREAFDSLERQIISRW